MTNHDAFLDRAQFPEQTSAGPMDFPILYRDIGGITALFMADAARAEPLLAGTNLQLAARLPGGKCVVGVAFFTYRDCTIASYNEAALALVTVPADQAPGLPLAGIVDFFRALPDRQVGTHILQLPVTTEQARAGGVECYGYPKFVADIDFTMAGRHVTGITREAVGGDEIVRLEGKTGFGLTVPGADVVTWSVLKGRLLRTHIFMDQALSVSSGRHFRLGVGPSRHAMAQQLRALDLDGARPFVVMRSDHYRSVLPLGTPV